MPLVISLVLLNKMKVIAANNDGPHHLGAVASTRKDATPDGNISRERAFFINVCSWKDRKESINTNHYDDVKNMVNHADKSLFFHAKPILHKLKCK